jgi:hypothetical protein
MQSQLTQLKSAYDLSTTQLIFCWPWVIRVPAGTIDELIAPEA